MENEAKKVKQNRFCYKIVVKTKNEENEESWTYKCCKFNETKRKNRWNEIPFLCVYFLLNKTIIFEKLWN